MPASIHGFVSENVGNQKTLIPDLSNRKQLYHIILIKLRMLIARPKIYSILLDAKNVMNSMLEKLPGLYKRDSQNTF